MGSHAPHLQGVLIKTKTCCYLLCFTASITIWKLLCKMNVERLIGVKISRTWLFEEIKIILSLLKMYHLGGIVDEIIISGGHSIFYIMDLDARRYKFSIAKR